MRQTLGRISAEIGYAIATILALIPFALLLLPYAGTP